ncbi:hypothetical protein AMJ71_10080 [candidate division TA06 bacterium SM1_40]|uniref:Uncharacterized protein n=1 Tax=candidate division TA06 bacterium SM1_40 TaxID=1703773 RepID=A0A0S8JB89_UNCT6|nr:MAG: hypothetical protein AMJ71_10080 [candidate division TA06 bacterium SM1_40]
MLSQGPKLNDSWIALCFTTIAVVVSIVIKFAKPLTWMQFIGLFATLQGTVVLATAVSFNIPPHGKNWRDSLKWAVTEFPKYGSTPSFSCVKFYLGLFLIFVGVAITSLSF